MKRNGLSPIAGLAFLPLAFLLSFVLCGCGRSYPNTRVQPAPSLGRADECFVCRKRIESVTEENYYAFKGNRYVVCDQECAAIVDGMVMYGGERQLP